MPEADKDQKTRDKLFLEISKKVDNVSLTVDSLLKIQKEQKEKESKLISASEEESAENETIKESEKQYRIKTVKLLEEIRDKQFFTDSGGGLESLLGLAGIGSLIAAAVPFILKSLLVAGVSAAMYKLGNMVYDYTIGPLLEKYFDKQQKEVLEALNASTMTTVQAQTDKGERLYTEAASGRTITEKEATQIAESQGKSLEEIEKTGAISPKMTTVNVATGEAMIAGQKPIYTQEDLSKMNEPSQILERQKLATPETQEDVQRSRVNNQIRQLDSWKQQLEQISSRFDKEYPRQEDADQDFNNMSGIIRQLVNYRQIINKDPNSMEYKVFAAYIKDNPLIAALSTETIGSAYNLGLTGPGFEPYFHAEYDTWFGEKGVKLKIENSKGIDYDIKELRVVGKNFGIPIDWIKEKENRSLDEYVLISEGKNPDKKYKNEGVIEGSRYGRRIIAGEDYTPEAVISTKPNKVTESIGNNLYTKLMENVDSDVFSTQRETMILGTALNNTTQEYNDAYKIAPLISTSSNATNPIIVNNMIGGMNNGTYLETNGQFNGAGLVSDKHENVLEKVYMDYYKAAML